MDNFLASYFMLGLGLCTLVIGLYFKHFWIFMISGGFWLLCGLYYIVSAGANVWVDALGIFCVMVSLPLFLAFLWSKEKKETDEPLEEEKDYKDLLSENINKLYNRRNRFRRGGGNGTI